MWVPLSGSQANGGLPPIARSIDEVSGKIGTTIQFRVTAKSWIMLGKGPSRISARVTLPSAVTVWRLTSLVKRPEAE